MPMGETWMLDRLNHVAIAVPHLGRATAFYAGVLGAAVSAPLALPKHGVTVVFVTLANTKIELLEPLGEASPIAEFLVRNPQGGIHHVCYEVADLRAAREALIGAGLRVLGDGQPRIGAHGLPVLFLHPKDAFGTLIELEQATAGVAHMSETSDPVASLAQKHGLSEGAVRALSDAVRAGHGGAQWSHPELGGMGQWSRGGMLQIGEMFNDTLKAKVAAVLEALSAKPEGADGPSAGHEAALPRSGAGRDWWPDHLGTPSSSGAQNDMRYACFPEKHRLAVQRNGSVTLYDTDGRVLTGFAQAQSTAQTLSFTGPDGAVTLDQLGIVDA